MSKGTTTLNRKMQQINEYHCDRAYGGSEEGGWWYDTDKFIACLGRTLDPTAAETIKNAHQPRIDDLNEGLPPIWSVASRGRSEVRVEHSPGEDYPTERPHYE